MPPIMITNICPSAITATTLPIGSRVLHEAEDNVLGAKIRQITINNAIAIQIVTKRVPKSKLLIIVRIFWLLLTGAIPPEAEAFALTNHFPRIRLYSSMQISYMIWISASTRSNYRLLKDQLRA